MNGFSFNLIDEPWIPCLFEGQQPQRDLSLASVFEQARAIRAISDPSPLVTAVLHRLLLAILHRNFGPSDAATWGQMWRAGSFDTGKLAAYFEAWHQRFDLFDKDWPFYQTAELPHDKARPVSKLCAELTAGNDPTLFDHSVDDSPLSMHPSAAARAIVTLQAFGVGGLITGEEPQRSADHAPLVKCALILIGGSNLFETLMLNFHRLDGSQRSPFEFKPEADLPAWERNTPVRPADRMPDGYLDLLTWQSRRVLLIPERDPADRPVARRAILMKGFQFPSGFSLPQAETMAAFSKRKRALPGQEPWAALNFRAERALWRDSTALLQKSGESHSRPRQFDWINDLKLAGHIQLDRHFCIDAFGLSTYLSKKFLWRHERLPLPTEYLSSPDMVDRLSDGISLAEQTGNLFTSSVPSPLSTLAGNLLAPVNASGQTRQPDQGSINALVKSLSPERSYWARLNAPSRLFITALPGAGDAAMRDWLADVRTSAQQAFVEATGSLRSTARELKAVAMAEQDFSRMLSQIIGQYAYLFPEETSHAHSGSS